MGSLPWWVPALRRGCQCQVVKERPCPRPHEAACSRGQGPGALQPISAHALSPGVVLGKP